MTFREKQKYSWGQYCTADPTDDCLTLTCPLVPQPLYDTEPLPDKNTILNANVNESDQNVNLQSDIFLQNRQKMGNLKCFIQDLRKCSFHEKIPRLILF